jgi:2-oxoisovalerate dehydrogenase E2 component (dihydrolipoyl transacylase)
MALHTFKLPDIGEGIAESEIAAWHVKVGDVIAEEQPLVDMLTDKAAVELPSPVAGKIVELKGAPGDKIPVGGALVVIETSGAGNSVAPKGDPQPKAAAKAESVALKGDPRNDSAPAVHPDHKPLASPATRRRAREANVDLAQISGTGPGGRVTQEDIDAFCAGEIRGQSRISKSGNSDPTPISKREAIEEIKIIGLRRKIAESMQRSKQRIPHFAYIEELDVTELEQLREQLNATKQKDQPKLTLLPFLMRAIVKLIAEFPQVNARFDDDAGIVRRYAAAHIGIATQTPNGLVVPVAKHAETLDVWAAAGEVKRLADAARAGKATRDELSGSTITITSLGALGGIASTPVINAPEVAIIGVNKIVERPMVFNGHIAVRKIMNLSSSFDHRVVDGYDAASFIQRVKQLLEHPATLFMP